MNFFIQHHLICSHSAVVCNGATFSVETAQMILNHCQTLHLQLEGNILGVGF